MELVGILLASGIIGFMLFKYINYREYSQQKTLCENYIDKNLEVVISELMLWAQLQVLGNKIPLCRKCGNEEMQLWNLGPYELEYKCTACKKIYSGTSYSTYEETNDLFRHSKNLNQLISDIAFKKSLFVDDPPSYKGWDELFKKITFDYSQIRNNSPYIRAITFPVSNEITPPKVRHRSILQNVKDQVWQRDKGECVQCGNSENLEFDHIIPHSKGGANTYRNVQLLCSNCNKIKSNNIG